MAAVDVGAVTLDRCRGCGGVWLDALEAEKLRGAGDPSGPREEPTKGNPQNLDATGPVLCPRCGVKMIVLMVERQPPLYFEHCGKCNGVFLDAGELGSMQDSSLDQWLRATMPGVFRLKLSAGRHGDLKSDESR